MLVVGGSEVMVQACPPSYVASNPDAARGDLAKLQAASSKCFSGTSLEMPKFDSFGWFHRISTRVGIVHQIQQTNGTLGGHLPPHSAFPFGGATEGCFGFASGFAPAFATFSLELGSWAQ